MASNLYSTASLSGMAVNSITSEIRLGVISNKGVEPVPEYPNIFYITEESVSVPPFNAPIEMDEKYYIDARRFTTVDKTGKLRLTDSVSAEYQNHLAVLERAWVHSLDKDDFFYKSPTNLVHYSNWLAKNLSHHFRLSFEEENLVLAACALFYAGLHFNNVTESSKVALICRYINNSKLPLIDTSIERVQSDQDILFPRTIEEFCSFITNANISLVFKKFDSTQFKNIIGRTFTFGVCDPTLALRLAIEHPPAWISLRMAITSNTYLRNTILGRQIHNDRDTSFNIIFERWIDKLKG